MKRRHTGTRPFATPAAPSPPASPIQAERAARQPAGPLLQRLARRAAAALLAAPCWSAAEQVACHITYGGETQVLAAPPVASPYHVPAVRVGSYFLLRVVLERPGGGQPAAVKVYAYADRREGPALVHQANFPWPPAAPAGAPYGFTGLHFVYEPVRDGELQYWCEADRGAGSAP